MGTPSARRDAGFTLVELLIVIVVLGILATVTVFAVRGITDRGAENACAVEFDTLVKAQELHRTLHASYADEATLVANGAIEAESTRYDVTSTGDAYQIVSTGDCVGGGAGGAPAPPPPPPGPVVMPTASFGWHGGVTAWRFGADANGADEIVVLGREQGRADWVAATDAGASSTRRVHFVDIDSLDVDRLDDLLQSVNNNGVTALGVYAADDTAPIPGAAAADLAGHLAGVLAGYPATTFHVLGGGLDLQALFALAP